MTSKPIYVMNRRTGTFGFLGVINSSKASSLKLYNKWFEALPDSSRAQVDLSPKEAAEALGINRRFVHKCYRCDGYIGPFTTIDNLWYCNCCKENRKATAIFAYHHKPRPKFQGDGPWHYGIELEVDGDYIPSIKLAEIARQIKRVSKGLLYCKFDNSVQLEMVSKPFTYEWISNNWDRLFKAQDVSRDNNQKSWDTLTCGLHIHISRTIGEKCGIALIRFFEKNKEFLFRLSGRQHYGNQYTDWTKVNADASMAYGRHWNNSSDASRNVPLNITPGETVEIRMFRGTLDHSRLKANIMFVHSLLLWINSINIELTYPLWNPYSGSQLTEESDHKLVVSNYLEWLSTQEEFAELSSFIERKVNRSQEIAICA